RLLSANYVRTQLSHFFLPPALDHPDLHSFPTRRSSDLEVEQQPADHEIGEGVEEQRRHELHVQSRGRHVRDPQRAGVDAVRAHQDRKSTRLNSSHLGISYAVFCLKKKKKIKHTNSAYKT